jgi:hypothetical protein
LYWLLDTIPQIRLFAKLKLRNCARAGNRTGLFVGAAATVGWVQRRPNRSSKAAATSDA